MATVSPTAMSEGSHFTALGRRTSARQAFRRPLSRQALGHSDSAPVGGPAPIAAAGNESKSQPKHLPASNDSSDDEIPVPMKLSALTKAILDDSQASEVTMSAVPAAAMHPASPPPRPPSRVMTRRSVLAASTMPAVEDRDTGREDPKQREARRHTRAGSAQLPPSRQSSPIRSWENSPAPRKRVVRLSGTPGIGVIQQGMRRSLSASTQRKRPESRDRADEKDVLAQPKEQLKDKPNTLNTPIVPIRTVRIAVGSPGQKGPSKGSSDTASKRSAVLSDQEVPADPATDSRTQSGHREGSVPRYPATGKKDEGGPQSSMRVRRIGKVAGSFLSGPARRGRRRQSEEDGDVQCEVDPVAIGREPELHKAHDGEQDPAEHVMSFFIASSYRDFASLGSPVSAKDTFKATQRSQSSSAREAARQVDNAGRSDVDPAYKIPVPPPDIPSVHDKENEEPPTFKRPNPISSTMAVPSAGPGKFSQPRDGGIGSSQSLRAHTSPARKVLAPRNQNTPHRTAPSPPKMSVVETATAAAGASATSQGTKKKQILLRVNGRTYTRIDCIGRGGSGKVYRVSAESGKMLALKRVSLENADENTVRGFKGEIDLLRRLQGVDRVIQLIDHELNMEKHMLSVLMDLGELDFNTLLKSRQSVAEGVKLDPVFIRFYWKEMLECVQAIHARDVVHSDLKPANFVLVQGRLKLIDFGIANAIQTEMTVNVHRETQIGTPNYMSPESLMDSNQYAFTSAHNGKFCVPPPLQHHKGMPKVMKLGKPSDVWSLGCILYQMVYGLPPFGKIANQMSRCQAIINWSHAIDFPEATEDGSPVPPSIIKTMKRCLNREQKERPTCDDLLEGTNSFLYPREFDPAIFGTGDGTVLPMTEELLSRIIQSVIQRCRERLPTEGEAISTWPSAYWTSVRKVVGDGGVRL